MSSQQRRRKKRGNKIAVPQNGNIEVIILDMDSDNEEGTIDKESENNKDKSSTISSEKKKKKPKTIRLESQDQASNKQVDSDAVVPAKRRTRSNASQEKISEKSGSDFDGPSYSPITLIAETSKRRQQNSTTGIIIENNHVLESNDSANNNHQDTHPKLPLSPETCQPDRLSPLCQERCSVNKIRSNKRSVGSIQQTTTRIPKKPKKQLATALYCSDNSLSSKENYESISSDNGNRKNESASHTSSNKLSTPKSSLVDSKGNTENGPGVNVKKSSISTKRTDSTTKKLLTQNVADQSLASNKRDSLNSIVTNQDHGNTNSDPILLDDSSDDDDDDAEHEVTNKELVHQEDKEEHNHPCAEKMSSHMMELTKKCWSCLAPLRQHRPMKSNFKEEEYPMCIMHAHPVLDIPICAYCSELVQKVELDQNDPVEEGEDSTDFCAGCGQEEHDNMFLCDNNNECNRGFCFDCVSKAHGGGEMGMEMVKQLQAAVEEPWQCPACMPPTQLIILRETVQASSSEEEKRDIDIVMQELDVAELNLDACQKQSDSLVETNESKIRSELAIMYSGDELEAQFDNEMELLREETRRLEVNLGNFIGTLQDEIVMEHKISLSSVYRDGLGIMPENDNDMSNCDHDEPDYVKTARIEIEERYRKQGRFCETEILDHEMYDRDDLYDDMEELSTSSMADGPESMEYACWRSQPLNRERALKNLEDARIIEDEKLVQLGIRIPKKVHEQQDEDETQQEEYEACGVSTGKGKRRAYPRNDFKLLQKARQNYLSKKNSASSASNSRTTTPYSASRHTLSSVAYSTLLASNTKTTIPLSADGQHQKLSTQSSSTKRSVLDFSSMTRVVPSPNEKSPSQSTPLNNNLRRQSDFFTQSRVVLCENTGSNVRSVAVSEKLVGPLKPHQVNGIKFMWKNCFSDFDSHEDGMQSTIGGCILAHHMGLGKTLSTITLLHTVMMHPSMVSKTTKKPLIRTVMLVVPKNTLKSWVNEFRKWLDHVDPPMIYELPTIEKHSRPDVINSWQRSGGILILTPGLVKEASIVRPHVLIMDEAHTILNNKKNQIYIALSAIKTRRKIALTGTPFQNNLLEYFRMVNFVRPGILGKRANFVSTFVAPIEKGMVLDASNHEVFVSLTKSKVLSDTLKPYVDRVNESELRKDLPTLQEVALYVRQSPFQRSFFQSYKRIHKRDNNFLKMYAALRPIQNHPGCLLLDNERRLSRTVSSGSKDDENYESVQGTQWWREVFQRKGFEKVKELENGYKIVLLLHILAHAQQLNEKVLIFANCMKTLDYIEYVLGMDNWKDHVSSLKKRFKDIKLGGWKKNFEYLRIDGSINSTERGDLVDKFNAEEEEEGPSKNVRAFLLSSKAGGVGISLQAATRVVLMDSHFNPAVMQQAVFRAYRYGQEKPVFCYRLLTEGTMEEKVYGRCVNKIGLGLQVIDEKTIERSFTAKELEDLQKSDTWAKCNRCDKWRMVVGETSEEDIPDEWFCEMNVNDPQNNTCDASEKDETWYSKHVFNGAWISYDILPKPLPDENAVSTIPTSSPAEKDEILDRLLNIKQTIRQGPLVSKHVFQETLLRTKTDEEALEAARKACEDERSATGQHVDLSLDSVDGELPDREKISNHVMNSSVLQIDNNTTAGKSSDASTKNSTPNKTSENELESGSVVKTTTNGDHQASTSPVHSAAFHQIFQTKRSVANNGNETIAETCNEVQESVTSGADSLETNPYPGMRKRACAKKSVRLPKSQPADPETAASYPGSKADDRTTKQPTDQTNISVATQETFFSSEEPQRNVIVNKEQDKPVAQDSDVIDLCNDSD